MPVEVHARQEEHVSGRTREGSTAPELRARRLRARRRLVRRGEAPPPARALRAERTARLIRDDARRSRCPVGGARASRLLVCLSSRAPQHSAPARLPPSASGGGKRAHCLGLLVLSATRRLPSGSTAQPHGVGRPGVAGVATFFVYALLRLDPFGTAPLRDGAAWCRACEPACSRTAMPTRVRRAYDPVALVKGRVSAPHRRALIATRAGPFAWMFSMGQLTGALAYVEIGWHITRGSGRTLRSCRGSPRLRSSTPHDPGEGDAEGLNIVLVSCVPPVDLRNIPHLPGVIN